MNSWQFYSNIDKYKANSMSHAGLKSVSNLTTGLKNMKNYGYYNKIDNFYGPGKSRYFYSKDEWDAYQREKDAMYQKAKDEVKYGKEIKADKEKNPNVYKAQEAREKAIKEGTDSLRTQQSLQVKRIGNNTDEALNDFIGDIRAHCSGSKKELEEITNKYNLHGDMNKYGYMDDPEWKKLYNAHVANYHSDDPGYSNARAKMTEIQNNYQAKRAQEMCQDIIRYVRENATPNNYYWIMKNPYVQKVLNGDIKTYDSLARMFRSLNMDRAETWDNSKNIKSWDKGETLYEDILKEDILKEEKLYEDILKEDVLKEKKLKEKKI